MNKAEAWLEKTLQFRFQNAELFEQALTHRSAQKRNNERLEFLGDAVLEFVVSEAVYRTRPDVPEGDLTKLRALLVKEETLAEIALELGLGEHLILGGGVRKTGGHQNASILADTLEAIFGAAFLDSGIDAAKALIDGVYESRYSELPDAKDLRDPKTQLQEWLQARKMSLPLYELAEVSGKGHKQRFSVTCTIAETSAVTEGQATTRRRAEQKAARKMIEQLTET